MLYWPDKDPGATLDYYIDWSAALAPTADTISSSTWTIPSGMTMTNQSLVSPKVGVWLSGGAAGQTYIVVNTITTSAGRVIPQSVTINVMPQ